MQKGDLDWTRGKRLKRASEYGLLSQVLGRVVITRSDRYRQNSGTSRQAHLWGRTDMWWTDTHRFRCMPTKCTARTDCVQELTNSDVSSRVGEHQQTEGNHMMEKHHMKVLLLGPDHQSDKATDGP